MDSINKNQPESNKENLIATEAIEKIKELTGKAKTCFFCTNSSGGPSNGVRPMTVQQVDDNGHIWFLSADDSYKNKQIKIDPEVKLFFQGSAHSDFMYITGSASISKDKNKIEELWEPLYKTWFTEGKNDPRITVIGIIPAEGYYWDTVHGKAVAFLKMLAGAAIGKTLDDSVEGKLKV